MSDLKISQFTDGGLTQTGDDFAAVRSGANVKVTLGDAAQGDIGVDVQAFDQKLEDATSLTGDIVGTDDAQTLTNKTIDGSANTITNINAPSSWAVFNGTGTPAVVAGYNVSSITDNGTGNYTVNFTTNLSNTNYAAFISVDDNGGNTNQGLIVSKAVSSFTVLVTNGTTPVDNAAINVMTLGGN